MIPQVRLCLFQKGKFWILIFLCCGLTLSKFYIAWVVVGIIWLWLSMLVAIFYPIFDGGIQQIRDVYRGLKGNKVVTEAVRGNEGKGDSSISPSAGSLSDTTHVGDAQDKS